jgi:hypothetical protein
MKCEIDKAHGEAFPQPSCTNETDEEYTLSNGTKVWLCRDCAVTYGRALGIFDDLLNPLAKPPS